MTLSYGAKITAEDNTRWKQLDTDIVVLNLDTGYYFTLNETASWLWKLFDGKRTVKEIIQEACLYFDVDEQKVYDDLHETVTILLKNKLVHVVQSGNNDQSV
jgi:hypothetical protein